MGGADVLRGTQAELFPLQRVSVPPAAKWAELCRDAVLQAAHSKSENTKLTYANQVNHYIDWAVRYEVDPIMPLSAEVLVSHLEWLKQANKARETIKLRKVVLCVVDQRLRATPADPKPFSLRMHPLVVAWWDGYCRTNGVKMGRAPYVDREDLRKVLRVMHTSTKHRAAPELYNARDRAILLLGYLGAFRRSELSAINIGDLEFASRGLIVTWRRSKTDSGGLGAERVILPQDEAELCAIDALERWLAMYRGAPLFGGEALDPLTPLFPTISQGHIQAHRMPETQIYQRVVNVAKRAGVAMSPHSLRAAFATHALEHSEESEVAFHGRWKSSSTMQPYVRRNRTWTKNPTGRLSRAETPTGSNKPS